MTLLAILLLRFLGQPRRKHSKDGKLRTVIISLPRKSKREHGDRGVMVSIAECDSVGAGSIPVDHPMFFDNHLDFLKNHKYY